MWTQIKVVTAAVALTIAVIYAPTGWRVVEGSYHALVKAEQMYVWLSAPLATVNGVSKNRANMLDCAILAQLTRAGATDINAGFLTDTGGCQ